MQYKFVGDDGDGKRKKNKPASAEEVFKFVGETSSGATTNRQEAKKLRGELSACLVDMSQEWQKEPVEIDEAKEMVLDCVEEAASEGGKPEEWRRMKMIIEQIEELDELVKYIYNYNLRAAGLSVSTVLGRRD